ncbi:MAG TPA: hypothetical protein VMW56_12955 [Candidatus Margulisiibacteriota bacterium]|nr:hypothetical protein [Candidatus Margulisiibacteriota bacterium]
MNSSRTTLRVFAVLIAVRALTDVLKPLGAGSGFVFFGRFLTGMACYILAPVVGVLMLVYAYGLWQLRRFALPMGVAYGALVTINLAVFPILQGLPARFNVWAYVAFAVIGLAVSWGAVWLLLQRREQLA